jgi:hypothetical protein
MTEPSPFYDPEASSADLDVFLREIDLALEAFVLAEEEHRLVRREPPRGEKQPEQRAA